MRAEKGRAIKQAVYIFLLIATLSFRILPESAVEAPRAVLMDVVAFPSAPLHYASRGLANVLAAVFSSGPSRVDLENEIARLESELALTRSELARAREALASSAEFKYVPGAPPLFVYNAALSAYVSGGDSDVFSRSYIVSVGSADGVSKGLPVVWGRVALGVVNKVSSSFSRVRVLGDPASRVSVRFDRSRIEGVLVGSGGRSCIVRFVPNTVSDTDIKVGEYVVTSGTDMLFPPDLAVGRVTRFFRRPAEPDADVEVELLADFSRIENCLVLKTANPDIPL